MNEPKECKYNCGMMIQYRGKTDTKGSTGFFEVDSELEHTYARCKQVKADAENGEGDFEEQGEIDE